MPIYHYIAFDANNRKKRGLIEAADEKRARQSLREQALTPIKLSPRKQAMRWVRALSVQTITLFIKQLAMLLASGLPLAESLTALAASIQERRGKELIAALHRKIAEGYSLATALRDYPRYFLPLMTESIAAGEKSGQLEKVLNKLAAYLEKKMLMQQKIQTALIYPSSIALISFLIVSFLLAVVVPKMVAVYTETQQILPWPTLLLIHLSAFIEQFGIYLGALVLAGILAMRYALQHKINFKKRYHKRLLQLPGIGSLIRTTETARFSHTLAMLSQSGVSILEAMNIATAVVSSLPIQAALMHAGEEVREGIAIHLALQKTGYFSPMSLQMIANGEKSGTLETMLEQAAEQEEATLSRTIERGLVLFEPAMILIMGSIVLFIVLAILLPIFQMNEMTV